MIDDVRDIRPLCWDRIVWFGSIGFFTGVFSSFSCNIFIWDILLLAIVILTYSISTGKKLRGMIFDICKNQHFRFDARIMLAYLLLLFWSVCAGRLLMSPLIM